MMRIPALAGVAVLFLLTGCEAAGNVANDAADAASDRASQEASQAVRGVVEDQICTLVGDGQLSDSDIKSLSGLVDRADAAGVPDDILAPVRQVVSDGEARAEDLQDLQASCPAPSS